MNYRWIGCVCVAMLMAAGCAPTREERGADPKPQTPRPSSALAFAPTLANPALTTSGPSAPGGTHIRRAYPIHTHITSTVFWVGEPPVQSSPSNAASAWDDDWELHYGGFDDPNRRKGFAPADIVIHQNPFYVALPYNDFHAGHRRPDVAETIPWFADVQWRDDESMCKNRWLRIGHGNRICYVQWEDVGPFRSDDASYVFGSAAPLNSRNRSAGIDVSPAVRDYLGLSDIDTVDWQFVEYPEVPHGPWTQIITKSQIDWH